MPSTRNEYKTLKCPVVFEVTTATMFNDLPLEIHHLIACNLDSKDFCQLVSSSRRLHTVFQQSLYTDVSLCAQDSKDQIANIFL